MRRYVIGLSLLAAMILILGLGCVRAQDTGTKAAQTAAEAWLSLVDKQDYAASWDAAASLFKNAIPKEKWQETIKIARTPFGSLKARTLKSATATASLPGAPDGQYVVFQFDASFEQKAAAVETVTAIREKDGTWHAGGYFIR